ncbi:MAG: hypothetical protein H6633_31310 [Anaerolineales bacterium]|nr:hypothetical protein [Anaerolineales bacterium]
MKLAGIVGHPGRSAGNLDGGYHGVGSNLVRARVQAGQAAQEFLAIPGVPMLNSRRPVGPVHATSYQDWPLLQKCGDAGQPLSLWTVSAR